MPAFGKSSRAIAFSALIASLAMSTATPKNVYAEEAARGSDGVELEVAPVDTGSGCSAIILKGTRRFKGSAFVMPRVLVGVTKDNETLFQIAPDPRGGYLLSLGLFFPSSQRSIEMRENSSSLFLHGCNLEQVKYQLNKTVKNQADHITKMVRLPVRNIEVVVDGVEARDVIGEVAVNGRDETSILNYEGIDHTVEFRITEQEKEGILRRLERRQGISIKVNMKFVARSSEGAMFAEVDLTSVAANLEAELKGKHTVASGELKTAMVKAVSSARITIETQAGRGAIFEKITENLMNLILSNVADFGQAPPTAAPTPGASQPLDSALPTAVNVQAVVGYLKTQRSRRVEYNNLGALQTNVYTTPLNFQARLLDPDVHEISVRSNERPATAPGQIKAGDTISLTVVRNVEQDIEYRERSSYLTVSDLTEYRVVSMFPQLTDEYFSVVNAETPHGFVAVGQYLKPWAPMPYFRMVKRNLLEGENFFQRYFWIRTEATPRYHHVKENSPVVNIDGLSQLGLAATFSKVGARKFQVAELVQDNPYWIGTFDEVGGKIEIVAKRDLGYLTVHAATKSSMVEVVTEKIHQEIRESGKAVKRSDPKVLKHALKPSSRVTYTLQIGRPNAGAGVRSATPQASPEAAPAEPAGPQQ